MSILTYLESLAGDVLLRPGEKKKVTDAVSKLGMRINSYFDAEVIEHFRFGSFVRRTNLPQAFEEEMDVDYLIVFADRSLSPKTLVKKLLDFADRMYPRSTVYQSSPAVVVDLSSVKLELVPAHRTLLGVLHSHRIPNSRATDWMGTNPLGFERKLVERNKECHHKLKAAIRLAKMWNAENNYVFSSFQLENIAVDGAYPFDSSLRDYFCRLMLGLPELGLDAKWRVERLRRGKSRLSKALKFEKAGKLQQAEDTLDDLFGIE